MTGEHHGARSEACPWWGGACQGAQLLLPLHVRSFLVFRCCLTHAWTHHVLGWFACSGHHAPAEGCVLDALPARPLRAPAQAAQGF